MTRLFSLFALLLLLASCGKEEQKQPRDTEELPQITMDKSPRPVLPPKPKVRLQDYQFKDLPGWKNDNLLEALDSFKLSCAKIMQEKTPTFPIPNYAFRQPLTNWPVKGCLPQISPPRQNLNITWKAISCHFW